MKTLFLSLVFLSSAPSQAKETKYSFLEFWKMQRSCSRLDYWQTIKKTSGLDLPETKVKPVVKRSTVGSQSMIIAVETQEKKNAVVANAWLGWEGRAGWKKLALEKETTLAALMETALCVYPDTNHIEIGIPDTDDEGVNPRTCNLTHLYGFDEPEFKFLAKKCDQ